MARIVTCLVLWLGLAALPAAAQDCNPNYGGVCVPIASDVDCAGGNSNGPEYVRGPVFKRVSRPSEAPEGSPRQWWRG